MEIRQINYFVALYEEGSVTRAARRLNVVQPAVSMQISKLEEELGHLLFQRMPKGMVPTSAGEEAYKLFRPLLRELRSAQDQMVSFGGRIAGHVSVGVIASVANNALTDCLESFCANYPDVSVRVTGGYTADFLDMLQMGHLDIAVINQPEDRGQSRWEVPTIPIIRENLALICSTATTLEAEWPVPLTEVAGLKLVIPSPRHGLRSVIDKAAGDASIRLAPQLEFDEIKTIEEFVQRTDVFTILPPIAVHRALRGGLLKSFPIFPPITRNIVCAHSPRRNLSPAAKLFIEQLRKSMGAAVSDLASQSRQIHHVF